LNSKKNRKNIFICKVSEDKLFEGKKAANKRLTAYFGIQGISFKVHPLMEIKDALGLIGL
jgi:hypothetical protein